MALSSSWFAITFSRGLAGPMHLGPPMSVSSPCQTLVKPRQQADRVEKACE
jgi:hypothetical protein